MNIDFQQLPPSLQVIIRDIRQYREEMTSQLARRIVTQAQVDFKQLEPWQDYDHPVNDSYGRKLVYKEDYFELMVMSWIEGDVSAIHDHGYTQWGAVQVFGEAEHTIFSLQNNNLSITSCQKIDFGTIVSVDGDLIHQMGNRSKRNFLTLHVYGLSEPYLLSKSVTNNARIFNVTEGIIERTDAGVFYDLPSTQIKTIEPAPKTDYVLWLRNSTEYIQRIQKINRHRNQIEKKIIAELFHVKHWQFLLQELEPCVDRNGKVINSQYFQLIRQEMIKAFHIQSNLQKLKSQYQEHFAGNYAEIYDEICGKRHLERFVSKYFQLFSERYNFNFSNAKILSLGCGTAIAEEYLIGKYSLNRANILGIDKSKSMIRLASKRIKTITKDILDFEFESADNGAWNLALATVNVFQYLPQFRIEEYLEKTARSLQNQGYLIADFAISDRLNNYQNHREIVTSKQIVSLQQPLLINKNGYFYRINETVNVKLNDEKLTFTYQKEPAYYLSSFKQLKKIFEKIFGHFEIFDAATLKPLKSGDEDYLGDRCLVIARKD
jgi:SAM-dependent methyltransferase/predicted metal-dependent enzyme (double-stranded beta helix superfamily)